MIPLLERENGDRIMKFTLPGLALLIGMSGAAHCQSSIPASNGDAVHPGTALLDSMGIFAGLPQPTTQSAEKPSSMPITTVMATPNNVNETKQ
jgi:hypothetical protein